jgi:GNAT superfamily N-acetyltransferase
MSPISIRRAKEKDIAAISLCGDEFFEESNWRGLTLSKANIYNTLFSVLSREDFICLLAETEEGFPAGFVIWGIENPWTIEKQAMMSMFYIRKRYRNGKLSTKLLEASIKECKNAGAKLFFSSSTAGFDDNGVNERMFTVLLKRQGFSRLGTILCRKEEYV